MTAVAWVSLVTNLVLVWGVALWSLARTLAREARKVGTAREPYDPRARRDLEVWLKRRADDPDAALGQQRLAERTVAMTRESNG